MFLGIINLRGIGATLRDNVYLYGGLLLIAGTIYVFAEGAEYVAKKV